MPSPSYYPDGTPRSPRYSDDDEMIEPAYFRAVRSRSQSRCGTPAREGGDDGREPARQAAGGNERSASSAWNASLPKPQLFSNVFLQEQFPSSSNSAAQSTPAGVSNGSPVPRRTNSDVSDKTKADRTQPSPPNSEQIPPPPPHERSPVDPSRPPPPPPPPPGEPAPVAPSNGYYKTTVSDPSLRLPPPPPPPAPSSLGVRLSVPSQPATKPSPPPSTAQLSNSNVDHATRKNSAPTVRSANKRSRQDALLEENPSPPRSPRRRMSRSPGPRAPLCPSQSREFGSKTPAHEPQPFASGSRTPGSVYGFNALYGAQTPAHAASTPHHVAQTPRYCDGSPEYKNGGARTPGYSAQTPGYGSRTPNQGPYGGCTPNYRGRTPNYEPQQPYGSQSSGHGGRSPGPFDRSRGPATPFYHRESPERGPHTSRDRARTPLFDRSSSSQTVNSSVPNSSKARGFNTGSAYAGHTPMRPPSSYPDGTPRSPRYEDNEEEAIPSYMRSPRYTNNEETPPVQSAKGSDSDPLSLNNRARTPPPPNLNGFQQNTPPIFDKPPPMNGFNLMGQPGMPPFAPPLPQNPFMPPIFGSGPFTFPVQSQFGMFPPPGMSPTGVPPPVFPPNGVPPPFFPNLQVSSAPVAPPQQSFAPASAPPPPSSSSSSNGPQRSPPSPPTTSPPSLNATKEPRLPTTTTTSKKSAPPQRIGGSVFLETPPPAPKPSASSSKPRKEHPKRKRRYSYDRSDSD